MEQIQQLFASARYELFEDGMTSKFAESFVILIAQYGQLAIASTFLLILTQKAPVTVACEALRWLGIIEDEDTYESRRQVLEQLLLHGDSAYVRDGALHGLNSLDDPESIPVLLQALEQEPTRLLQKLISNALRSIKRID